MTIVTPTTAHLDVACSSILNLWNLLNHCIVNKSSMSRRKLFAITTLGVLIPSLYLLLRSVHEYQMKEEKAIQCNPQHRDPIVNFSIPSIRSPIRRSQLFFAHQSPKCPTEHSQYVQGMSPILPLVKSRFRNKCWMLLSWSSHIVHLSGTTIPHYLSWLKHLIWTTLITITMLPSSSTCSYKSPQRMSI